MEVKREPLYDGPAIVEALIRISAENESWQTYFEQHNIRPLHISYEQLTSEMDSTVRLVMEYIGVKLDEVPAPQTKRQSDSSTSEWATRFVEEFPQYAHRAKMLQS